MQRPNRPSIMAKLSQIYVQETPQMLQEIRQAIADKDYEAMRRVAHSFKSASRNIGALSIADFCLELENMGREQNIAGADEKIANIEAHYEQVKPQILSFIS